MGQYTKNLQIMMIKFFFLMQVFLQVTIYKVDCRATPQFGEITIPAVIIGAEGLELLFGAGEASEAAEAAEGAEAIEEASFYSARSSGSSVAEESAASRPSYWRRARPYAIRSAKFTGKAAAGAAIGVPTVYYGCKLIGGQKFCSS